MIKTSIHGGETSRSAEVVDTPHGSILMATTPSKEYSYFKTATRATAGTTVIVQPRSGDAIALTDLVIAAGKKDATLVIRFTDGTNTVNILSMPLVDTTIVLAIPFQGRWMGWRDARIEMVTDDIFDATVTCGYLRVDSKHTLSYAEWDAAR